MCYILISAWPPYTQFRKGGKREREREREINRVRERGTANCLEGDVNQCAVFVILMNLSGL